LQESGKSTIINRIRSYKVGDRRSLDFGIYINADDIAAKLRSDRCDFSDYDILLEPLEFKHIIEGSGLLNADFSIKQFERSVIISENTIAINLKEVSAADKTDERVAQIIADYLRVKLLTSEKKFSFETVFSHQGKVRFIQRAREAGYKVYLYFVATEDPEINIYRVKKVRVKQNGHDVPEEKIRSRYYRSLDFLHEAAQYCYQVFFFDNSKDGSTEGMFAHFKLNANGEKIWDPIDEDKVPLWFYKYYSDKNQ
jgi:predicted ABC-type ATPase